ncbi:MAG: hypothetical protein N6V41_01025 [Candidatus Portiera aleyrodidarum]|nr:hypothetical protein [Candidatus Portiera aleyrodidarum]
MENFNEALRDLSEAVSVAVAVAVAVAVVLYLFNYLFLQGDQMTALSHLEVVKITCLI